MHFPPSRASRCSGNERLYFFGDRHLPWRKDTTHSPLLPLLLWLLFLCVGLLVVVAASWCSSLVVDNLVVVRRCLFMRKGCLVGLGNLWLLPYATQKSLCFGCCWFFAVVVPLLPLLLDCYYYFLHTAIAPLPLLPRYCSCLNTAKLG